MTHTCHLPGCSRVCPTANLFCLKHWNMVPSNLQALVNRSVRLRKSAIDYTWAPWWRAQAKATEAVLALLGRPDPDRLRHALAFADKLDGRDRRSNPYLDLVIRHKLDKDWSTDSRLSRSVLCNKYSWAVPTREALMLIQELNLPVIELGAGTGYWAHLLQQLGVDVEPYDMHPPPHDEPNAFHRGYPPFTKVLKGSVAKLRGSKNKALMLCWPPMSDFAYRALKRFEGDTLIYIGEGECGCTANDEFFELLEKEWSVKHEVEIVRWMGINDRLGVWRRRQERGRTL